MTVIKRSRKNSTLRLVCLLLVWILSKRLSLDYLPHQRGWSATDVSRFDPRVNDDVANGHKTNSSRHIRFVSGAFGKREPQPFHCIRPPSKPVSTTSLSVSTADEGVDAEMKSSDAFTTKTSTSDSGSCLSGDFDAITRTDDGDMYAFKGSMVIKLTKEGDGVDGDFPRTINSTFPGLPSDLDAAVFWDETGKTYFFKGDIYYQTSGTSLDSGYPQSISEDWGGVPSNIDAAVVWNKNGKTYFFKGDQYYRYDPMTKHVDGGYPENITKGWPGLPSSVTAALQWTNPTTYLFVREDYYRYNDELDKADSGYPLPTSRDWLGCGASKTTQTTCWAKKC